MHERRGVELWNACASRWTSQGSNTELSSQHTYDYVLKISLYVKTCYSLSIFEFILIPDSFVLSDMHVTHSVPKSLRTAALRASNPHFGSAAGNFTRTGITWAGILTCLSWLQIEGWSFYCLRHVYILGHQTVVCFTTDRLLFKKLRGLSPQANYTNRPTEACRRS
jgi:hypothetical protein